MKLDKLITKRVGCHADDKSTTIRIPAGLAQRIKSASRSIAASGYSVPPLQRIAIEALEDAAAQLESLVQRYKASAAPPATPGAAGSGAFEK